jgi:hypothetical protein
LPRPAIGWQVEELDLLLWLNALTKCQPYQPAKNQKDFKLTTQDVQGDLGLTTQGVQGEQKRHMNCLGQAEVYPQLEPLFIQYILLLSYKRKRWKWSIICSMCYFIKEVWWQWKGVKDETILQSSI